MIRNYLLLFLLICPVFSQTSYNYIWPTNASRHMTSSFCEYRPGHYHSALDIKTWNKEGYPIYAVSNASIYRIRVSPFGYGKVIYLKLDDGNFAVYAHLQKFNNMLEEKVHTRQLANRRYTLNWMPENIRVKQGDLLGYTGQTGIGVPHLHFEIRDPYERPMNPLRFYNQVKDTRPPVLRSFLVIPKSPQSRVNNSMEEQAFNLVYRGNNTYVIKEPIRIKGPVGLAISGFDQADGVSNVFAFYKTILKTDGKPIFHLQYDIFDFAITEQVDVEIFYPQKVKNNIVYHKLYIEPYNQLPFYDRSLGNGIIYPEHKHTKFQIEVSDFRGNTSRIIGTLENQSNDALQMQILNPDKKQLSIRLQTPYNLKGLTFYSSTDFQHWQKINQFEIHERELKDNYQQFLLRLTRTDTLQKYIKTDISTNDTSFSLSGQIPGTIVDHPVKLRMKNLGKYLALEFTPLKQGSGLTLSIQNNKIAKNIIPEVSNGKFQYVINNTLINTSPIRIKLFDGKNVYVDSLVKIYKLIPEMYQQISFFSDSVQIISRPQSVYDTLLFDISKSALKNQTYEVLSLSPVYHFNSAFQPLKQGVRMHIKLDSVFVKPEQVGLYTIDTKNNLELVESRFDTLENSLTGKLESLGEYFVAADTTRPELQMVYPSKGQRLKALNLIRFTAKDEQSGIGVDTNLLIRVDGQFVLPEWDPERDIITGRPHWPVNPGMHEIAITVSDMAGNQSTQKFNIIVE
ncbi:MAG: M23 family metallopeptidase [Calditrichaceae bacterium]|jgi:hypothetical protein